MSLKVHGLSYIHPNKDILFQNISFSVSEGEKCAIVGNNGIGKSTLLSIIAGNTSAATGSVLCNTTPYIIPQHFGQFNSKTIAEVLGVSDKLNALSSILGGNASMDDFAVLNDEWDIKERLQEAFARWGIGYVIPDMFMRDLSGGEKTKVFLAGMYFFHPSIILMDEPTNHLDIRGRALLNEFIRHTNDTVLIVSHDRVLLNILFSIYELSPSGIQFYPMCYSDYKKTVDAERASIEARVQNQQKELAKAEKAAQKVMERQQKHASRGEKQSSKKCLARIAQGNLRDKSESSTSRLKKIHQERLQAMKQDVNNLQTSISKHSSMQVVIGNSQLSENKRLLELVNVTYQYFGKAIMWINSPLNLSIYSGERIWFQGDNGCGKSTLLKLITGELHPTDGEIKMNIPFNALYLDQEYSFLNDNITVYEQLESCNGKKPEHELKMLLNRFQFPVHTWDKKCCNLSGGERMKLALCCLLVYEKVPDMIIVDEPTNNIDISSMEILADTLKNYSGTLLIVSHDEQFVQDVGITRIMLIKN